MNNRETVFCAIEYGIYGHRSGRYGINVIFGGGKTGTSVGEMLVSSCLGEGSVFTIRLPRQPV